MFENLEKLRVFSTADGLSMRVRLSMIISRANRKNAVKIIYLKNSKYVDKPLEIS